MSLGYGAFMKKNIEDDEYVLYEYGSYNLNNDEYRNKDHKMDGIIKVKKSCFVEPEIHRKIKRMPSKRKKIIEKKVIVLVNYIPMLENGDIKIENCSNAWEITLSGIDRMCFSLLFKLFMQYQEEGSVPENISCNV